MDSPGNGPALARKQMAMSLNNFQRIVRWEQTRRKKMINCGYTDPTLNRFIGPRKLTPPPAKEMTRAEAYEVYSKLKDPTARAKFREKNRMAMGL